MRAVINATGFNEALTPLVKQCPSPLFHVANKPLIIHLIEHLVPQGVVEFDIILSHHPEMIEAACDEGKRWGVKITYHLARDEDKPFAILLPAAKMWNDKTILLARADILPKVNLPRLLRRAGTTSLLLTHANRGWLGWGLLPISAIRKLSADTSFESIPKALKHESVVCNGVLMSAQTFADLQHSNMKALETRSMSLFPATSRMVEPGVWLSRATTLHPNTKVEAPSFIGENTQIMEGAHIGPYAVIENDCIVDKHSIIERSLVRPRSYIGEGLEIRDSIVDHSTLINLSLGTTIEIADDFILSHLSAPPFRMTLFHAIKRLITAAFLLVIAPILMPLIYLIGLDHTQAVRLPAVNDPQSWETFTVLQLKDKKGWRWMRHLPMLFNIARGDMAVVGLKPRSPEELESLPQEWKSLVLISKTGLINLADLDKSGHLDLADPFTSDAFYASHAGVILDTKIMFRWLKLKLRNLFKIGNL